MTLSQIHRLRSQHLAVAEIIEGTEEAILSRVPREGKWSIAENIAHITAYQNLFTGRMRRILSGESLSFQSYSPNDDPLFLELRRCGTGDVLKKLREERKILSTLLEQITPAQEALTAIHAKYGKMSVVQWTEFFLLHEAHHIFTIFKILRGVT